ncbi:MAG: putative small lipoprotein YifL [Myxococcota bacterium]|jgi:predicted small lipoprotein YifL
MMRRLLLAGLAIGCLAGSVSACGKSGPKADTVDVSTMKEGTSHTVKLKFWMNDRCAVVNAILPCSNFDDAKNQRLAFVHDDAVKEAAGKLEQNKVYEVTFTYENPKGVRKGVMTAVK